MHGLETPALTELDPPLHAPIAGHLERKSRDPEEVTLKFRNGIPLLRAG